MLVLSLPQRIAASIYDGTKRCELRKTRARVGPGDRVAIYETRPRAAITGGFVVDSTLFARLEELWEWMADAGVPRERFGKYFGSREFGLGIRVRNPLRMKAEIRLEDAEALDPTFHAPQSFVYLENTNLLVESIESRLGESEIVERT